jgi:tetratricopeptide (TPR) repeat protein
MKLKRTNIHKIIFVCVALLFVFPVFAEEVKEPIKTKADTNREVAMTYAQIYVEQKLFDEAETALQLSLKNDGENGSVLNYLGLIQLQQKNFSQACYSFQTASIVFQDIQNRIYALYNLADCLHQGGRQKDAINVLKDLKQKEDGVSDSAEKTLELIHAGVIQPRSALPPYQKNSRGQFRLTGTISGGFDTNVLLVEEEVSAGVAIKDRGSFYYTPSVQFGYLSRLWGKLLDARFVSAYTSYIETSAAGYNNLYNRMDLFLGSNAVRWGFFSDLVFLNTGSFTVYNYDIGLMWQRMVKTGSNEIWTFEVPFKYQKFVLTEGTLEDNDRSGGDVQAKVFYRSQWSDREFYSLGGTLDNQYTLGKNYRMSGLTLPFNIGLEIPVFSDIGLLNTFNAEVSGQLYWQSDTNRRDYSYKFGTGITAIVLDSWNLSLDYYYYKNNSNVDAATYSKGVASFLLSHHFL